MSEVGDVRSYGRGYKGPSVLMAAAIDRRMTRVGI
jgi:hypothetical protein